MTKSHAAHVAFDPLQNEPLNEPAGLTADDTPAKTAKILDFGAVSLSQDLQLSLESSLEALSHQGDSVGENQEAETPWEQFDLDEVDSEDADFASSGTPRPQTAFSFSVRNVAVASGLVVGSFIFLWTRDLVTPTTPTEPSATKIATPHLMPLHATKSTNLQGAEQQQVPSVAALSPLPTHTAFVPTTGGGSANESNSQQKIGTTTDAPVQIAKNSAELAEEAKTQPFPSTTQAQTARNRTLVFSREENGFSSLASNNGTPFVPGNTQQRSTAPIIGLPQAPTNAILESEGSQIAAETPTLTRDSETSKNDQQQKRRPRFRPRNNNGTDSRVPPQFTAPWPRKAGDKRLKPMPSPEEKAPLP